MNRMIIVLAGPSGAGKGRIFEEISKRRSNVIHIPSVTTRKLREYEIEGVDYIVMSKAEFLNAVKEGCFFEWVEYDDNFYGTLNIPTERLLEKDIFFDKDVRGALSIKGAYPEAITIYVMPKDNETLIQRRGNRGKDRQKIGEGEIELAKKVDFLVINDDIQNTIEQVENIIEVMRKNSMKNNWNIEFLDNFY